MSFPPTAQRNICLTVSYQGSAYLGWQSQLQGPTIEGELKQAIAKICHEEIKLQVAGRTDRGVHAIGQVCNFKTHSSISAYRLTTGINAYLPDDIVVQLAEEKELNFSARHHSLSKVYKYRVYLAKHPLPFLLDRAWHLRMELDVVAMRNAAQFLLGEQDFESFRSVHCDADHAIRRMLEIEITEKSTTWGNEICISFHANAYCRHMCRILAGTLVEVGQGKREPESIKSLLHCRDRSQAGMTAPPHGLTLIRVFYPETPELTA